MDKSVKIAPHVSPVESEGIRKKFVRDGFVYPLQVFDNNLFLEKGYLEKYQEFRKKCEIPRTRPEIPGTECKVLV